MFSALLNTADVGVWPQTGDLRVKGDFLRLPGHPWACRHLHPSSARYSSAVPATSNAVPSTRSKPAMGTKGTSASPSSPLPLVLLFLWLKPAGSRRVSPIPLVLSWCACPSSYARKPHHGVRQELPVPRLLRLALHGSGCPEQLPGSPPDEFGSHMVFWLQPLLPAAALPPWGHRTVAAGTSCALSPDSRNQCRRMCRVGEDGGAPWG